MSATAVDLTLLAGSLQALEREARLLRVQVDQLAGELPARMGAIDARVAVLEQTAHALTAETARGFGQVQQQQARHEARLDAVAAGLASLRAELAASTAAILSAIRGA